MIKYHWSNMTVKPPQPTCELTERLTDFWLGTASDWAQSITLLADDIGDVLVLPVFDRRDAQLRARVTGFLLAADDFNNGRLVTPLSGRTNGEAQREHCILSEGFKSSMKLCRQAVQNAWVHGSWRSSW